MASLETQMRPPRSPLSSGMSLLEVILAIAVAGFVLAAATSFLVSISTIWTGREDRNFFEDHVDGVTEFLNAAFANAGVQIVLDEGASEGNDSSEQDSGSEGMPGSGAVEIAVPSPGTKKQPSGDKNSQETKDQKDKGGGLIRASDEPIGWARPPGFPDHREPLLNFKLAEAPPLLVGTENAPLLGIDLYLYFEPDEGLSLLWYSVLQEKSEDIQDLRRTQISPLVTDIRYIYWDERFEQWEEEERPKEGGGKDQYLLPRFIKIVFEYEGATKERTLSIPVPSTHALIF